MRQNGMWMWFCLKRLFFRPLFLITLLFFPVLAAGMRLEGKQSHAMVQVGVFCEDCHDVEALELTEQMVKLSNAAVLFVEYFNEESLCRDVTRGKIQAGYIIPCGLREKLADSVSTDKPIIRTVRRETELTLKIVDELVICRVYEYLAYDIGREYIQNATGKNPDSFLKERYDIYREAEMPFVFQYENGEENQILSGEQGDYLLLPVQGMVAVLVLMSAMSGAIFWYEDQRRKVFVWLTDRKQLCVHLIYIFVPAACAGLLGYVSLLAAGIYTSYGMEAVRMVIYVPALVVFIFILQMLLGKENWFLVCIPLLTAGELLVCPVFINLAKIVPALKYIRMLTPVNYYMESAFSVDGCLVFLCYCAGSVLFACILTLAYRLKV